VRNRPIALLTDFGLRDPYVGAMKGVIASIAPQARVIDISHDVPPFGVREGAWILRIAAPYFPPGTVFVVVVDPGVGTGRRILLAKAGGRLYLAPDNGLLGDLGGREFRAVTNRGLFLENVSSTFHGRDIFAPVAARLARGLPSERVGPRIRSIVRLPRTNGRVVWIDRFGNVVTDLPPGPTRLRFRGRRIPVVPTYAAARRGRLVAVVGSSGTLEIAAVEGNAARRLGARVGEAVRG
jgi:S-adenosylmethionine hydrolase